MGQRTDLAQYLSLHPLSGAWGMETPAPCTLLRDQLCGSQLVLVCLTLAHQRDVNKLSLCLNSRFHHSSTHQMLMECPLVPSPVPSAWGLLVKTSSLWSYAWRTAERKVPELFSCFSGFPEATRAHRKPFLHCPSQARKGLETSCFFLFRTETSFH